MIAVCVCRVWCHENLFDFQSKNPHTHTIQNETAKSWGYTFESSDHICSKSTQVHVWPEPLHTGLFFDRKPLSSFHHHCSRWTDTRLFILRLILSVFADPLVCWADPVLPTLSQSILAVYRLSIRCESGSIVCFAVYRNSRSMIVARTIKTTANSSASFDSRHWLSLILGSLLIIIFPGSAHLMFSGKTYTHSCDWVMRAVWWGTGRN